MSEEDLIFKLIEDIEGSGESTRKALNDLMFEIEERLKSKYCRDAVVIWKDTDGELDPVIARFGNLG
jgi:hypothetical protein